MPIINFLFQNDPMLEMPSGVSGWLGWLCFLGLNIYLLIRWWGYNQSWKQTRKWIMALLVILVPLTSLVFPAIQLSSPVGYALLNIPKAPPPNFLVIFGSVPWFLAAGLLGPAYAAALAAFSGLSRFIRACLCCSFGSFFRLADCFMGNNKPISTAGTGYLS
jgi:hypothetical protein